MWAVALVLMVLVGLMIQGSPLEAMRTMSPPHCCGSQICVTPRNKLDEGVAKVVSPSFRGRRVGVAVRAAGDDLVLSVSRMLLKKRPSDALRLLDPTASGGFLDKRREGRATELPGQVWDDLVHSFGKLYIGMVICAALQTLPVS